MGLIFEYSLEIIIGLFDFFFSVLIPKKIREHVRRSFWLQVGTFTTGVGLFFSIIALLIIWANKYN